MRWTVRSGDGTTLREVLSRAGADGGAISDGRVFIGLRRARRDDELVKVVRREDFMQALGYVNDVGRLAESVGHHPDFELRWNTVTLRLQTHSLGGITSADVALAASIDAPSAVKNADPSRVDVYLRRSSGEWRVVGVDRWYK